MSLNTIEIKPKTNQSPVGLIVLLHGWGANAQDLASLVPMLDLDDYQFLCPDAPFPHPHVPEGKMWYDLETGQYEGLVESRQQLTDWLNSLEAQTDIPLQKTILSGFSQGGAMTLDVGLGLSQPVAGLVSMSGYLQAEPQPQSKQLPPISIMHGKQDPIVPISAAIQARDELLRLGANVEFHEFEMAHEICPDEIKLLREFVHKAMAVSN